MIFYIVVQETNEYFYSVQSDNDTDAMESLFQINPMWSLPSNISLLYGPAQIDLKITGLVDCNNPNNNYKINADLTKIPYDQSAPVVPNGYMACLRELRNAIYTVESQDLTSAIPVINQLNPSGPVPDGVTLFQGTRQMMVNVNTLYDPNGKPVTLSHYGA